MDIKIRVDSGTWLGSEERGGGRQTDRERVPGPSNETGEAGAREMKGEYLRSQPGSVRTFLW